MDEGGMRDEQSDDDSLILLEPRSSKKKPGCPGFFCSACAVLVERPDVGGLVAFGSGRDVVLHFLVFTQALEAVALHCRKMRGKILAAGVGSDDAESLGVGGPFECTVYDDQV